MRLRNFTGHPVTVLSQDGDRVVTRIPVEGRVRVWNDTVDSEVITLEGVDLRISTIMPIRIIGLEGVALAPSDLLVVSGIMAQHMVDQHHPLAARAVFPFRTMRTRGETGCRGFGRLLLGS